jgi:exoribonuclease-2
MLEPGKPPIGHFGLAVMDYTHSTAPNRRFVDVIIQRLVKAVLTKRSCPYSRKELIEHAAWCTDRDKAAKKVERFMQKVAAAILMDGRVGEVFDALVTGASEKGTYVRLMDPPVEGRVVRGFERMRVGDTVRVRLSDLDPYVGHIDFERVKAR